MEEDCQQAILCLVYKTVQLAGTYFGLWPLCTVGARDETCLDCGGTTAGTGQNREGYCYYYCYCYCYLPVEELLLAEVRTRRGTSATTAARAPGQTSEGYC